MLENDALLENATKDLHSTSNLGIKISKLT